MVFMIAGILVIDFLKWDKHSRRYINRLIWKAIFFGIIIVGYYLFYNDKTGKSNFADDYLLYATYFSRMSNVKVSIYDLLNQGKMLQYPCQTLLYNLLFLFRAFCGKENRIHIINILRPMYIMAFLIKLFLTCNFKLIYGLNLYPTWGFLDMWRHYIL